MGDSNRGAHFPSMLQGKENEFDFMFFTARFGGQMHGFKAQKRHENSKSKDIGGMKVYEICREL